MWHYRGPIEPLKSSDIRKDKQSDITEGAFWMLLLALNFLPSAYFDKCIA